MFDRNMIQIQEDNSMIVDDQLKDELWYGALLRENGGGIYLPEKNPPSVYNLKRRLEIFKKN